MAQASHGSVLDALGLRIASGRLAPGEVRTLADLEAEYGVSRTVVREAVRVLEALGMLASRRRVGLTVTPVTSWSALDTRLIGWQLASPQRDHQIVVVNELRSAVEPIAARLAAGALVAPPFPLPARTFRMLRHRERYRSRAADALLGLIRDGTP